MKTITPKSAFKLFLFLLILFSAKTFSQFPDISNDRNPSEGESRIGEVKQTTETEKMPAASYSASRAHVMSYKNDTAVTSEVTSKFGLSK